MNLFQRYNGTTTPNPVIPVCKTIPDFNPTDNCSTGSITIWTDQGRAIYNGLLTKLQKRFAHRYQFQASYAFQKATTDNVNVWNEVNYVQSGYGQYLPHHQLQVAGTGNLPWGFTLSLNMSIITTSPTTPSVNGLILPGTVAAGSSEPLPGVCVGCLNSSTSHAQLAAAVAAYNSSVQSGSLINANGTKPNLITLSAKLHVRYADHFAGLPAHEGAFRVGKERKKKNIFGEMFNAFNISNKGGPSMTLDNATVAGAPCQQGSTLGQSCSFGQSTSRPGQTFGSAGPRAVQVGARFTF